MEVLPCSRVAHIERTKKPYNNDIDYYAKRNALRAAEVWMDDFKSHVYMAWNIPMAVSAGHAPCPAERWRESPVSSMSCRTVLQLNRDGNCKWGNLGARALLCWYVLNTEGCAV